MSRGLHEVDVERCKRLLDNGDLSDSGAESRLKQALQSYIRSPTETGRLAVVDHLVGLPKARQAEFRQLVYSR